MIQGVGLSGRINNNSRPQAIAWGQAAFALHLPVPRVPGQLFGTQAATSSEIQPCASMAERMVALVV